MRTKISREMYQHSDIDNKELTSIQEYLVISKLKWWSGVITKKKIQGILSEQLTEA